MQHPTLQMNGKKNIFLIGFMGAGKSTIARCLHSHHGMEWLEMDKEGMPVSEIFRRKGEEYFRELETGLLLSLESRSNTVVSCGGGVPLRSCNVEAMKRSGIVVFLTARPETILERVKDSHDRPLLEGHKDVEYIAGLLSKRLERYQAAADVQIATDGRRTAEIAEEICALL